jgi:type I restriction enzyme S subunit
MESMKNDVGMRWERMKIKDITINLDNKRKPLNEAERNKISKKQLYPYIGANNIMGYVDEFLYDEEIVCIAEDGGSWGENQKCCVHIHEKCWVNNHAHVLGTNGKTDLKFLMYYLNANDLNKFITGSTRGKLTKSALDSIQIPLPPLPIQKRIAEILDVADALKRKDQALLKKYDELAQAIFIDMFGDPVKNEKGWEVKKLGELSDVGSSVRVFVDELVDDGIPFLRGQEIGAMSNGEKIEPSLFITQEHYNKLNKQGGVPKIGDLLMPSICPDGRIFQVIDNEPFYFKDGRVLWIKTNEKYFNSEFLKFLLKEKFLRNYSNIASGSTFAELKIFALKALELPVPPINLQEQFSNLITSGIVQRNIARNTTKFGSCLFQTLIQKAFKGELVAE